MKILKTAVMLLLAWAAPGNAAIVVSVDMDTVTPGVQATRSAAINAIFTIGLVMTADAAGVSSYSVSVNFDNAELTLNGAPASTELLPAGFTFNFNAGVSSESQALGQVRSFEAATFGLGPVSSSFTIGTISFKATAPLTDAFLDVTPGLFNIGIDGVFDNAGFDLSLGATFIGGAVMVVPEPTTVTFVLVSGMGLLAASRRPIRR